MNVEQLLESIREFDVYIDGIDRRISLLSRDVLARKVTSIVNDHRLVDSESIFIALQGNNIDSHAFIGEARKANAALIVGERGAVPELEADLVVGSTRAIIGPLADALYDSPSSKLNLVGITGTNGKTTVSYLYSSIIREHKKHCFTMGTTGILLDGEKEADSQTTPDPLVIHKYFSHYLADGIDNGALEVSSHALDQYRVLGTTFSAVAFTNFSQDHLDYHETMEQYFESKAKLFSDAYSSNAVVNIDDSRGPEIVKRARDHGQKVTTVSCKDNSADVYIHAISTSLSRSELVVNVYREENHYDHYSFTTPLIGDFNHENIAVALGLALATGCDIEIATRALDHPETVPGRLQRSTRNVDFSIFVDYAHTPDALERVLTMMKPLARKLIVVFGCGGDRDHAKRPIMGAIASRLADTVIVTSDNPRSENPMAIIEEIIAGTHGNVLTVVDRREAIKLALLNARQGDAVVIAGKGHEHGQVFADHVEEFSDINVVNEQLLALETQ